MNDQNFEQLSSDDSKLVGPGPKSNKLIFLLLVVLAILISYSVFINVNRNNQEEEEKVVINESDIIKVEDKKSENTVVLSNFASYSEFPVNINPKVLAYSVGQNLNNISNSNDFTFSSPEKSQLIKNAFFVRPAYYDEFFQLYENNRYGYVPSFITTDSILHNYHLMFAYSLKQLEEEKLIPEVKKLSSQMLSDSTNQYKILKGGDWENAAKRNVGFFSVGASILDPSLNVDSIVKNNVERELVFINDHQGIEKSPVMNIGSENGVIIDTPQGPQELGSIMEDYSQYIPRGHYDKNEELRTYFKSMMWYGRLSFRLKNIDEVKSAVLITLSLSEKENYDSWNKIYEPINFFVGKSDDITYYQFKDLLGQVYGQNFNLEDVIADDDKLEVFVNLVKKLDPPQINSMPIFEASIQADRNAEIMGFRFLGQRFTIDASIFQRLIYREVGDKSKSCQDYKPEESSCLSGARCLPKGLDIPATMGSKEASSILERLGEASYACYQENMSKMQSYLGNLPINTWTQNLYWSWLYQLLPLLSEKTDGYPSFMRNNAWLRKDLNTFLGSFTELKHDTILYAKQVYAELGAGMPEERDDRGYVEPNPYVYSRLASLLKMTREGLESRGILDIGMKENFARMEELALSLKVIAEKELNGEKVTDDEYEIIRSYGGQLEHLWIEVNKNEQQYKESSSQRDYLDENPAAIVADIATDPNGQVLELGTGKIFEIYVVVPIDGELRIAKGGVYSYYEFSWPMSDRLTDKKWREMIDTEQTPELPQWTDVFIVK
ncbi:hypothetical protein CVU82_01755 [Candidatus Falkowbacteria bacterium HGW-Falkowbacteria-1]|uniref:DUF3160 domain-containing protein n=1 Tax=Candidatus Falkowbacteria bacterium HGW-Falkowbacteria-1 TaxID=2013768 RepID=A0A2N2E983_9BACT|nr:MAG: hypothetical protein CVU82_01755 [Candidatus Falkowbacteria bacterium HGW-Falkowbacteria-1]